MDIKNDFFRLYNYLFVLENLPTESTVKVADNSWHAHTFPFMWTFIRGQ